MAPKRSTKKTELAVHKKSQDYSQGEDTGTLTTVVHVQSHANYESIRRLEVDVKLRLNGDKRDKEIGYIVAWVVDKTSKPTKGKKYWITELLEEEEQSEADTTQELRFITRTLYTKAGKPRASTKTHSNELRLEQLVFVDTFKLYKDWRGKSIGPKAMAIFHSLIPEIVGQDDDSHTIAAVGVLSPAQSDDVVIENGKTVLEVEQALQRQYVKSGYETWIQGDPDKEGSVSIMGRLMEIK